MESFLIPFICVQLAVFNPQYNTACSSAITAASIQSGLHKDFEELQKKVQKEVTDRTGEDVWKWGLAGYSLMSTQTIKFITKFKPISDSLDVSANQQTQTITLTWAF